VNETTENASGGTTGRRGVRRLIAATGDSLSGLASAWRSEEAFRLEAVLAVLLLPAALWIGSTAMECFLLVGAIVLVMIVELLNTAVEYTVDRIGTDHHHLSGGAKDLASAAVFLSVLLAAGVWGFSIWGRFFRS
jgi:diacylglycerol kinase (ATP)